MTAQPDLAIILVAAGSSTRMGFPKLWTPIGGQPLLAYAVANACAAQPVELILVVSEDRLAAASALVASLSTVRSASEGTAWPAAEGAAFVPTWRVVTGGARRRDSVAAGLAASSAPWLAIHDAARALAPPEVFARGLAAARASSGAAIPGVALKDTIKRIANHLVLATPLRSEHIAVQTPQLFRRDILERALALTDDDVTDEASLVERLGIPVAIFEGDERALKVTTPLDFAVAEIVLAAPAALASRKLIAAETSAPADETTADAPASLGEKTTADTSASVRETTADTPAAVRERAR